MCLSVKLSRLEQEQGLGLGFWAGLGVHQRSKSSTQQAFFVGRFRLRFRVQVVIALHMVAAVG